jgi:hypothetical protein
MTKFLKRCSFFLVIVILLNVLYLLLLLEFSAGFRKIQSVSKFKDKDYDLIVLGNSMALDGVDALYLSKKGIKTYNMAVAGNHISTTLLMLDTYLQNNQNPKMVMVGLSSAVGNSYLNPVSYNNPEVDFFYKPSLWSAIKNPPLLNFQWLAIDMSKTIVSKDHRNAQMIQGQWRTQKVIPDFSIEKVSTKQSIDYSNVYLKKIVKLCEAKKIELILIEMTGSIATRNNLPFHYQAKIDDETTVNIFNLNNSLIGSKIVDPMTDWLAPNHLNVYGAKKQTTFIFNEVLSKEYNQNIIISTND